MSETAPETPATDPETPAQESRSWDELFKGEDPAKVRQALEDSRKWEQRAKANKAAADRLAEIEEASKTEAEKTAERLAAAEKDASDARREALRLRIATRFQISDEDADLFLTASDEETLTRQAERLAGRASEQRKQGHHVPREGDNSTPPTDERRAFADFLTGNRGS